MFQQVQDTSASPTLSRLLTAGMNRGSSIKSDRSSNSLELSSNTVGVDSLCAEMNNLMHEFEVVSRIAELVSTLKGSYKVHCESNFKALVSNLVPYNVERVTLCCYSVWIKKERCAR
jgi:Rho guanine nucleotide exchange factor 10